MTRSLTSILREQPPYCIDAHYCDLSEDLAAITLYLGTGFVNLQLKIKKVEILSFRN